MSEEAVKKTRPGRQRGSRNKPKPEPAYAPQIHVEVGKARFQCHEIKEEGAYLTLVTYGPGYVETRCVAKEGTLVRRPWQPPQPQVQRIPLATTWQYSNPPITGYGDTTLTTGSSGQYLVASSPGAPPQFRTNLMPTTNENLVTMAAQGNGSSAGMLDS